jgi:hypothetical protein
MVYGDKGEGATFLLRKLRVAPSVPDSQRREPVSASVYAGPSDDATPDRLLDAYGVAEILQVPVTWVQLAGLDGRLPSRKIGLYRRYVRAEILDWLAKQSEGRR